MAPSQLRNAERTEALGIGRALPQAEMSAETMRAAARDLLTDGRYREAAATARLTLDHLPGIDSTAELIEALAPGGS
jgi:UDP:flavonoid glycosyltransferase YjiC (YdhE family)